MSVLIEFFSNSLPAILLLSAFVALLLILVRIFKTQGSLGYKLMAIGVLATVVYTALGIGENSVIPEDIVLITLIAVNLLGLILVVLPMLKGSRQEQ